jgi:hypothetical protein
MRLQDKLDWFRVDLSTVIEGSEGFAERVLTAGTKKALVGVSQLAVLVSFGMTAKGRLHEEKAGDSD